MRGQKLDCKEPQIAPGKGMVCRWCGRSLKYTHSGKLHHRRGYVRIHPDPRKK